MKRLKIEGAGLAHYNGLNCRYRTAFINDNGDAIYFEFDTGHTYKGKKDTIWLHISHLFRADIKEDREKNYTRYLSDYETKTNARRLPYTKKTIKKVLEDLGLTNHEIDFIDYDFENHSTYAVHANGHKLNLGNAGGGVIG